MIPSSGDRAFPTVHYSLVFDTPMVQSPPDLDTQAVQFLTYTNSL